MIKRGYRAQESQIRYWVDLAEDLSRSIDDESFAECIPQVDEAIHQLRHDRRILVFGTEGCGKSALLAGICGCPVIAKAKLEAPYVRWRYICGDGDSDNCRFLAEESLDGLELVDTKSCTDESVAEAVAGLMLGADVLIAAIDARHAKESPVWKLLEGLPKERLETCLLAATFTDKLSAEASLNIAKNLQEFCKERLGEALRICVSNPTSEQSMASFATRVQEILDGTLGVRAAIRNMAERGLDLVRREGRVLNNRASVTRTDVGFLSTIEQEIDNIMARQELGIPNLINIYSGVALKVMPELQSRLKKEMGYVLSPITIMRLERLAAGTENCLYNMICSEILQMQHETDRQFIFTCTRHWDDVRPRMMKKLACEIGNFPEETLASELANLRTGLCHDLHEPFKSLQLRHKLSKVFLAPAGWMQFFFWGICFILFVSGVLGFIGLDETALWCVSAALLLWLIGSAAHFFFVRHILAQVETYTGLLAEGMRQALCETIGGFVVSRGSAYRSLYVKPRQTVSQHEIMLAPLQQRYKLINMQLNAAAQRL